ncbi:MAG: lipoate--protein ligase family protein, partial [Longimicrobiales bacterium]
MAVDQALLESVAAGAPPVLRLYRWRPACLSFGRNQAAAGIYNESRARLLGIGIVRRPTGGLSVLHDAELTYAVVAPAAMLGGPRAAYHAINRALAMGLQDLGIPAELAGGARRTSVTAAFRGAQPCFALPAGGEVVVNGRKLVGSAQRVERRTILQHGSILLDGSQAT